MMRNVPLEKMPDWLKSMPKAELHAHISGSISVNCLRSLAEKRKKKLLTHEEELPILIPEFNSYDEIFLYFRAVQSLLDHPEAVTFAVESVLNDFRKEGVRYVELRTTPRESKGMAGKRMTKRDHLEAVVKGIRNASGDDSIEVTLLLSIDRRHSIAEAEETLELALSLRERYPEMIKGLDVSGNNREGNLLDFMPILRMARCHQLKLAIHLAEVPSQTEVKQVLQGPLRPDRLGHCVHIHPSAEGGSDELWSALISSGIPVEICMTSNVAVKASPSYDDHHVQHLEACGHPYVICTDDRGALGCTLSQELFRLQNILNLSPERLYEVSLKSLEFSFADELTKRRLKTYWNEWKASNFS